MTLFPVNHKEIKFTSSASECHTPFGARKLSDVALAALQAAADDGVCCEGRESLCGERNDSQREDSFGR